MTVRDALLRGKRRPRNLGVGSPTIYRGDGYEFVELRAYVAGDDVRRIDWAATARSGDLQTRVILEDVALTLAAIVDGSPSMYVGRRRPLFAAVREAVAGWFGAAGADDRCLRVAADAITPPALQRNARAVLASIEDRVTQTFDVRRTLRTAHGCLPRGTALLAISDWFDLDQDDERLLAELGARYDCTALVARDPWYEELPLAGIVRLRGVEGGAVRAFVGARERESYRQAVRAREASVVARFKNANWRTGILHENDGAASLGQAFGLRAAEVRMR
ncbi:MAG: DUF58 domain-containing protein [Candidatus Eremiobacteraeota bacterium]|nr:DUF58 domain-containing protein [Candidatus Eremiobacteraeota bacterium]